MNPLKRWAAALVGAVMLAGTQMPAAAQAAPEDVPFTVDQGGYPLAASEFLAQASWVAPKPQLLKDGSPVAPDELVATGQTLRVFGIDAPGTPLDVPVVVIGDVTGTGQAGLGQITRIAQAMTGREPLEGIWLAAGDINGSGQIDLGDLVEAAQEFKAVTSAEEDIFQLVTVPAHTELLSADYTLNVPLHLNPGQPDIPYISTDTIGVVLGALLSEPDALDAPIAQLTDGQTVIYERPNGTTAWIDFETDTICVTDYDRFYSVPNSMADMLFFGLDTIGDENADYPALTRLPGSFRRAGNPVAVDLSEYGIDCVWDNGRGFIPLQTFSDLLLAPRGVQFAYNGRDCFLLETGQLGKLAEQYYAVEPGPRSAELAAFNYNELCLALDLYYGLADEHDIHDFDALFRQTGLRQQLLSSSAETADKALGTLVMGILADMHSSLLAPSPYAGADATIQSGALSPSIGQYASCDALFRQARAKAYPEGVPAYEEIGDTAYVTLDAFLGAGDPDDAVDFDYPALSDVPGIIREAQRQITRPDSPVRNVVLDLTCNGGGAAHQAVYAACWLLGAAECNLESTLTGAQTSVRFRADVNGDGNYAVDDSVSHLKCYCLISPVSFSAGTVVPALLKGTDVTLIGQPTSGGACAVMGLTTADGSVLTLSGPTRFCQRVNGSYYEVDRGITPDYPIAHVRDFYDRQALTEYIASL